MKYFTRRQVIEILHVEETFLVELEQEEILMRDCPPESQGDYSDLMLERVRVAYNLVSQLEVNLPGAAVIIQMREEMTTLRQQLAEIARELERRNRE